MTERRGFIIPKSVIWGFLLFIATTGVGGSIPIITSLYSTVSYTSKLQEPDKNGDDKITHIEKQLVYLTAQVKDIHDFMLAEQKRLKGRVYAKANSKFSPTN